MSVEVNLFSDFAEEIRTRFGIDPTIDQMDVVTKYAWFELRRLPTKKWTVRYSTELQENQFFVDNRSYIDIIRNKAEQGEDLTVHASTLIDDIQSKDEMLADWGIYHLHPGHGTRSARNDFVNRSGELLFVIPFGDTLYFLDVLDHNSWTNFSLIEIIDNNWPSIIDKFRLKNAIELSFEPTEVELYELRKNQINSNFRVGNSFFSGMGGGIASNGSAIRAVQMAINVKRLLNDYSDDLKSQER